MTLYLITWGGHCALYEAPSKDAALLAAARDHFRVDEATEEDVAWHRAMSGPIKPEKTA